MTRKLDPEKASAWDEAYDTNDTPWDLSGTTPELERLLTAGQFKVPGDAAKILVPGCGRGFDAIRLAQAGQRVTALDFSAQALKQARRFARTERVLEKISWTSGDFFAWAKGAEAAPGSWDFVWEYTFFCAIPVARRRDYADVMAKLLKPGGKLIGLSFPLEPREGGPPFSVSVQEVSALLAQNFNCEWSQPSNSVKPRKGREQLLVAERKTS